MRSGPSWDLSKDSFFFFLGSIPRLNPYHGSDPKCCSDNTRSLICCATKDLSAKTFGEKLPFVAQQKVCAKTGLGGHGRKSVGLGNRNGSSCVKWLVEKKQVHGERPKLRRKKQAAKGDKEAVLRVTVNPDSSSPSSPCSLAAQQPLPSDTYEMPFSSITSPHPIPLECPFRKSLLWITDSSGTKSKATEFMFKYLSHIKLFDFKQKLCKEKKIMP